MNVWGIDMYISVCLLLENEKRLYTKKKRNVSDVMTIESASCNFLFFFLYL